MKQHYSCLLLMGGLTLGACGSSGTTEPPQVKSITPAVSTGKKPIVAKRDVVASVPAKPVGFTAITKDFDTWYNYTYYNARLGQPFKGLDANGKLLTKREFLDKLITGKFIALRQAGIVKGGLPAYRLHSYTGPTRIQSIWTTSKQLAEIELENYKHEGKPLPAYKFVDLDGTAYTPATTRGKLVVLKCWYIGCIACVNEFPAVNALADKYKGQDVLFVSLAMDEADKLRTFLQGRQVKFAVVPDSRPYLVGALEVAEYPTHFVVGRDGNVLKVTNQAIDLAAALAHELQPKAMAAN